MPVTTATKKKKTKLDQEHRLHKIAETLHETGDGNPRLLLDVRFMPAGHVRIGARDADNNVVQYAEPGQKPIGLWLTCRDAAEAVARAAEIMYLASRRARRS
jgi:hypothetical protein